MLNKALLKEVEKGLPEFLYYIWSEENFFLEEALSKFIDIIIASSPMDFNYDVFYSSSTPQEILNAASTLPFMAPRRLVVIKDFHLFTASSIKALTPYFKEPAETACMAILSQKAPQKSLEVAWKIFQIDIKENEIPAWVKQAVAKKGIRLTDEAADYLIDYIGNDIGLLMTEIEKLSFTGNKLITGKDIIETISMTREYTTFDLVDSLVAGQSTRAFRILKTLFSGRSDSPAIIGTLNWHYKQFYSLWVNKGKRPAKMREKTYRALIKYVPSFSEEDFSRIFQSLHEADLGVKSSGRPELVLDVLLIKLLQKEVLN
ncbi:MAG: DNA polymerase III subunit delta [Nitrospirae bacterium]|nr:DNA polymerase III subunit delta [Nitrospirota bacterium]